MKTTSINCELLCSSSAEHLNQIYAGFGILAKKGIVSLKIRRDKSYRPGTVYSPKLKVVINNSIQIVYDVFDGENLFVDDLETADFYFKRSFNPAFIVKYSSNTKIFPLGFNYSVYGTGDYAFLRSFWSLTSIHSKNELYEAIVQTVRSSKVLSSLLNTNGGRTSSTVNKIEALQRFDLSPKIIFLARFWDPERQKGDLSAERYEMNEMRANCIRKLRKEFGNNFIGGVPPSEFAEKYFPDCIIENPNLVRKKEYLKLMKESSICVATAGLLGSNGWKLAEYVATSKSIVSERLRFSVPGEFQNGKNYLEFSTSDECISKVHQLFEDEELRYNMMVNNYIYYNLYLRPDILVWNTIHSSFKNN